MSFSSAFFQKDIYSITRQDLEVFFTTEQEENASLEFKSGETSLEDVYKEVAAFLNTEGGLLIIGAPRESKRENDPKIKVCKGPLTPCTKILSKDTLTRAIAGNIMPSPAGIRIQEIYIEGGSAYILEVPQSMTPPHQVTEKGIYFIRLERDAKAAPHGVVEALFRKRDRPALTAKLELFGPDYPLLEEKAYCISIFLHNESYISAENVGWELELKGASKIYVKNPTGQSSFKNNTLRYSEQELGRIFVNGIEKRLDIHFKHDQLYIYLSFTYYCKDLRAEKVTAIISGNKIMETYQSRDSGIRENDLLDRYNALRKDEWINLLPSAPPLSRDAQYPLDLAEFISYVPFSEELYEFYSIFNGLNCVINGHNIELYKLEQLFESRAISPGYIKDVPISSHAYKIGTLNQKEDVLMILKDDNTFSFGRLLYNNLNGYKQGYYARNADSLYDLLRIILTKRNI